MKGRGGAFIEASLLYSVEVVIGLEGKGDAFVKASLLYSVEVMIGLEGRDDAFVEVSLSYLMNAMMRLEGRSNALNSGDPFGRGEPYVPSGSRYKASKSSFVASL